MKKSGYNEDGDDEDDFGDEGEAETIPCPYCRKPIFEESERCPSCGNYITEEDPGGSRHSWWIIAGVILCLAVALMWVLGG